MMNNDPCIKPLDHDFGEEFDVVKNEFVLNQLIDDGIMLATHLGTPCTSFTRARFPVLRNADSVLGVHGLNPEQQELVRTGNEVAEVAARLCARILAGGGFQPRKTLSVVGYGLCRVC